MYSKCPRMSGQAILPSQVGAGTLSPICNHRIWSAVRIEGTCGGSCGQRRIFSRIGIDRAWLRDWDGRQGTEMPRVRVMAADGWGG